MKHSASESSARTRATTAGGALASRPRVLAIVPAMNEEESLPAMLDELAHVHPLEHTLIVDDGSSDETPKIARRRGCRVVRHPYNLGYGAALLTGYHYALRHSYPCVVQLDADGQHPPEVLPEILAPVLAGEADVVVGSRYLGSGESEGSTALRRFAARPLAILASLWTGLRITDPTSGLQALSPAAVATLCSDGFPEDYPDVDVLITLHRAGLRLREHSVRMRSRESGTSMHGGVKVFYYFYRLLVTLMLLPWRRSSPYRSERIAESERRSARGEA